MTRSIADLASVEPLINFIEGEGGRILKINKNIETTEEVKMI